MTTLSLPTCTAAQVPRLAWSAGLTGLASQLALTEMILAWTTRNRRTSSNSTTVDKQNNPRQAAAYLAHNVVAFALMVTVSLVGLLGYYCGAATPASSVATPAGRLLAVNNAARWLAAVLAGLLAVWDVPTSLFFVQELRQRPDVLTHHVAMAAVAWLGATALPTHYLFFYLGVSEVSSVPLLVYDQLAHWTATKSGSTNEITTKTSQDDDDGTEHDGNLQRQQRRLVQARNIAQVVAAIAFTVVRAVAFTFVTLRHFLPDVRRVLLAGAAANNHQRGVLQFAAVASLGFCLLQLFWFSKVVRVVVLGEDADAV